MENRIIEPGRGVTITISRSTPRPFCQKGDIVRFKRMKRMYGIVTAVNEYSFMIKGYFVAAPKSTIRRRKSVFSKCKGKIQSTEFYLNKIKG